MSIRMINGGMLTTVQDLGRIGYQRYGVPVSGAMDPVALATANILLDNDKNEAGLEMTLLGPAMQFTADNCACITGADFFAVLDDIPVPRYRAFSVKAGQTLAFKAPRAGCRAYLAFAGGLQIEPVMGSRSTCLRAQLGGFNGHRLAAGDEITFRSPKGALPHMNRRVAPAVDFTPGPVRLRVLLGPQDDAFTERGRNTFLSSEYVLTNRSDRMGCRLDGPCIEHIGSSDILSDSISFGAVQVPADGKPIVMMADRQTTGGYTKIANVISADLPKIAQAMPGTALRFETVSMDEARAAFVAQQKQLARLKRSAACAFRFGTLFGRR